MREIYTFGVKTDQINAMVNITSEINKAINESGVKNGICVVCVPHTSAGITVNESADPDAVRDFLRVMNSIVADKCDDRHTRGSSAVYTRASLTGCSLTLIIDEGRLLLGTWQGVYFTEFDGPRIRKVHVKIMEG